MKTLSRRGLMLILATVLTLAIGVIASESVYADNINVYVTVERTLIANQDPILEPYKVTVPSGSTVVDILNQVRTNLGSSVFDYTMTGSVANGTAYIRGFKVSGHPDFYYEDDYEFVDEYNDACPMFEDFYWDPDYCNNPPLSNSWLQHGDFNFWGGWIVSANNTITWDENATSIDESYPNASSQITQDNTVLRFEYTCALARDCGYDGWDLLMPDTQAEAFYTAADKSALVRAMANETNKTGAAYLNGLAVLKNMTASQSTVNAAVNMF
ncbi:MAG: hypothetical protein IKF54_03150 [Eubacterium sp.]|nr:hypothetical protein [Eubacterium sp.]